MKESISFSPQPTAQSCQCTFMAIALRSKSTAVSGISGEWEKIAGPNHNQPDRERRCAAQYEARDQIGLDKEQANRASVVGNGTKTAFAEIGAPGKVNPSPRRHNNYRKTLAGLSSVQRSMPSAKHYFGDQAPCALP